MKYIFTFFVACVSLHCFGSAFKSMESKDIIKVSLSPESEIKFELALQPVGKRILACLVADHTVEEGISERLLAQLISLKLRAVNPKPNQFEQIKEAIGFCKKRVAVFVIEKGDEAVTEFRKHNFPTLYLRILNETTNHQGRLDNTLYCKLSCSEKPSIRYEEPGMAEEIWKDAGGFASDELGFEVNGSAILAALGEGEYNCAVL